MTKYIPKDALLAEIKRLREKLKASDSATYSEAYIIGAEHTIKTISDVIDTLEVKGGDLNKCSEITWNDVSLLRHIMAEYRREVSNGMLRVMNKDFCKEVLKRFKAQKGE